MSIHVYVNHVKSTHVGVHMHVYVCACRGRRTLVFISQVLSNLFFKTKPLIGLKLTKYARLGPRDLFVSTSLVLILQGYTIMIGFLMWVLGTKLGQALD